MDENLEYGYYDDTEILPTIDISKLNRKEVKNLAQTIAGRENPQYGLTYKEVLNDKANIIGKFSRQEDRFKRLVKKQYKKNVRHTQQIERAKKAGEGDVQALQNYITTGTTEASKYIAPLVYAPAVASVATSGALGTAAKGISSLLSKGYIRWPLEAIGTGDFIYRNATGQGFQKTANKFREGDIWGGLGSASLDLLDSAGIVGAGYDLYKASKAPSYVRKLYKQLTPRKRKAKATALLDRLSEESRAINQEKAELDVKYLNQNFIPPVMYAAVHTKKKPIIPSLEVTSTPLNIPGGKVINVETATGSTGQGFLEYPVLGSTDQFLVQPVIKGSHVNSWFFNQPTYIGPRGQLVNSGLRNIPLQVTPNPEFSQYVINAQQTMGNSGVIGGSTILFDRGYISGVPHDLEIITTKSRQGDLIQRIGFDEGAATKLPLALSSKSKISAGEGLTDIQMIDEDPQGFAVGKLAHELYRILHPEDHAEYLSTLAKQNYNNPTAVAESFKLPKKNGGYYTANELLDEFLQSGAITKKTLVDALSVAKTGMSYQQNPQKLMRPIGILSNTDPNLQPEILDAIHTLGKINLGKDYKTIRELYPNIDFSDVAKNEEFLESLGFDKRLATNPQAVENIAEYYHLQLSGSQRVYNNPQSAEDIERFAYPTKDWGGGRAKGAGGNSTIGTAAAFEYPYRSMGQFPVVKQGTSVTSPLDILTTYKTNRHATPIKNITTDTTREQLQKLGLQIDDNTTLGDIDSQLATINDEKVTESVGDILGIYGVFGGDYGRVFGGSGIGTTEYFGRYSKQPVASSYRIVTPNDGNSTPSLNYEMGRLLHKYKESSSSATPEELEQFVNSMHQLFEDFLSGKITEHTGIIFKRGDYDKMQEFKKEFDKINSKSSHNFHKQMTVADLQHKYHRLGLKIDDFIRSAVIIGATGLGAVGAGWVTKQAMDTSRANKYFDEFKNTDEYQDSYYRKLINDPEFGLNREVRLTKDARKHRNEAYDELHDASVEFGKKRHKENKKAAKENFLKQFSEFQPNNLGYLMHGK